jgi:hypothetical protein
VCDASSCRRARCECRIPRCEVYIGCSRAGGFAWYDPHPPACSLPFRLFPAFSRSPP